MKRIISLLETIALVCGSLTNINAWTKANNEQNNSSQTTNEDAEDIAGKIYDQSIKIDPNFWLGKDIKNYQSQFNTAIVKDGILTQDEVQYVSWGDLTIKTAGWYRNDAHFTVSKDGSTATGTATVNANEGDTAQQIANKLQGKTINLDLSAWYEKPIAANMSQFQQELVNQKLVNADDAKYVYNDNVQWTPTKVASYPSCDFLIKKDGQTVTASNITLNITDNETASQIAAKLANKTIDLDPSFWNGKDIKNYHTQLANLLVQQNIVTKWEVQFVSWGDLTVASDKIYQNCGFTITKKQATAQATNITLNVSGQSTPQQIANKLTNKTINLSSVDWTNKNTDNPTMQKIMQQSLINSGYVSIQEARSIKCVTNYVIKNSGVVGPFAFTIEVAGISLTIDNVDFNITNTPSVVNKTYYDDLLVGQTITLNSRFLGSESWSQADKVTDFQESLVQDGYMSTAESKYFSPKIITTPTKEGTTYKEEVVYKGPGASASGDVVSNVNYLFQPTDWVQSSNVSKTSINLAFTFSAASWQSFVSACKSHFTMSDKYGFGAYLAQYANDDHFPVGLLPGVSPENNYIPSHTLGSQFTNTFAKATKESQEQILADIMSNTNSTSFGSGLGLRWTEYYLSTASKWNPKSQVHINASYTYDSKTDTYNLKSLTGSAV